MDRGTLFMTPSSLKCGPPNVIFFSHIFLMLTKRFLWFLNTLQAQFNTIKLPPRLNFQKFTIELCDSKYFSRPPLPQSAPLVHFYFFNFFKPFPKYQHVTTILNKCKKLSKSVLKSMKNDKMVGLWPKKCQKLFAFGSKRIKSYTPPHLLELWTKYRCIF